MNNHKTLLYEFQGIHAPFGESIPKTLHTESALHLVPVDSGSKELLLYKKLILANTKLLVLYSGLYHLTH